MEVKISKNSHTCFGCNKSFMHEEFVWSCLVEMSRNWNREDYCESCWERSGTGKVTLSKWYHRYIDSKVVRQQQEIIPESPLRRLFYKSVEEENSREMSAVVYLCAQLLRREKVFKKLKEMYISPREGHIIIFLDRIDNRVIEVRDPNFTYAEMEEAKERVRKIIEDSTGKEEINVVPVESS